MNGNPVFPEELTTYSGKFYVRDRVCLKSNRYITGVVTGYSTTPGMIWVRFTGDLEPYLLHENDFEKAGPGYSTNPVYPEQWEPPAKQPKFKLGQRLQVIRDITSKMRAGYVGRVLSGARSIVDPGEFMYFIYHPDHNEWVDEKDLRLNKRFGRNPVYPEEWQSHEFQAGDYVKYKALGVYGTITCVTAAGSRRYYDVRIDVPQGLNPYAGARMTLRPDEIEWTGERRKYRNNPIYPEEWHPTFRVGERFKLTFDATLYDEKMRPFNMPKGSRGTVKEIRSKDVYVIVYDRDPSRTWGMVSSGMEPLSNDENEIESYGSFNNNPVYPETWFTPKFNVGDVVIGKIGTYINVSGQIDRVPETHGNSVYYHIDFGGGLTDLLREEAIRLANSREKKFFRRRMVTKRVP